MILHNYFRSSASYRVRIALNLKGISYEYRAVHLNRGGGEQLKPPFLAINPQALVPVLEHEGKRLTQSIAIMEYLDETQPMPPLLPESAPERARVRALSLAIACDIHPLNNVRVLNYLTGSAGLTNESKSEWYRHWVRLGLAALEAEVAASGYTGAFCHGNQPGMADCCLVPQLFNARRFACDLSGYPTLLAIERRCLELEAFQNAAPERQPDAE
jgi:maleylpyruvate isomerase